MKFLIKTPYQNLKVLYIKKAYLLLWVVIIFYKITKKMNLYNVRKDHMYNVVYNLVLFRFNLIFFILSLNF